MNLKNTFLGACLAASAFAMPAAFARVDVAVQIGVPPPAPVVEYVPAPRYGYVWAPGYWAWYGNRHVWVRGRYVIERPGYYWVADRWVSRGPYWRYQAGYWAPHRYRRHAYYHYR
jgi:hypothetical protein